jgi:hypothetical protein
MPATRRKAREEVDPTKIPELERLQSDEWAKWQDTLRQIAKNLFFTFLSISLGCFGLIALIWSLEFYAITNGHIASESRIVDREILRLVVQASVVQLGALAASVGLVLLKRPPGPGSR